MTLEECPKCHGTGFMNVTYDEEICDLCDGEGLKTETAKHLNL